jgi:hypothetical protein
MVQCYSGFTVKSFGGAQLKDSFMTVMWRDISQLHLEFYHISGSHFECTDLIHKSVYPSCYTAIKCFNSSKLSPMRRSKTSVPSGKPCATSDNPICLRSVSNRPMDGPLLCLVNWVVHELHTCIRGFHLLPIGNQENRHHAQ